MKDYILFQSWVPRNQAEYFLSLFCTFMLGVMIEAWTSFQKVIETRYLNGPSSQSSSNQPTTISASNPGGAIVATRRRSSSQTIGEEKERGGDGGSSGGGSGGGNTDGKCQIRVGGVGSGVGRNVGGGVERPKSGIGKWAGTLKEWWNALVFPSRRRALARGGIRIVTAVLAYLLMLIIMNFNAGLFFAAILGLGFGSAIFGGIPAALTAPATTANEWQKC
ncbi:hypothetical protein HDU76_008951 [Blyttiomyces sp. JEL0837]|nr:hypothetical protein HDU76_008951 [Blyttiomyces sp. JEL0837]